MDNLLDELRYYLEMFLPWVLCFALLLLCLLILTVLLPILYYTLLKSIQEPLYEECTVLDIRDSGRDFMLVCETESSERFLLKEPQKSLFVAGDSIEIEHLYNKLTKNNKYYYKGKCVLSCKIRKE